MSDVLGPPWPERRPRNYAQLTGIAFEIDGERRSMSVRRPPISRRFGPYARQRRDAERRARIRDQERRDGA